MTHAKRQTFISKFYAFILIFMVTAGLLSCKKEYPALPYNDIEQFTIKDADGNDIKASIDGSSIIVYYPPFQTVPDKIKPVITVSEGATVTPASGSEVEYKDGTAFEVKAADGSTKIYTLKAYVNQPTPTFEVGDLRIGDYISIPAEYLLPDTNQTKLYLINTQNNEIQVSASTFTEFSASRIVAPLPAVIDTGNYRVRLITGTYNIVKGPIHIDRPGLMLELPQETAKKGGDITLVNTNNSMKYYRDGIATKAQIYYARRNFVEADVISITDTEIKLRLPADFPGSIITNVVLKVEGLDSVVSPLMGSITVTD
ncbi:hypothetical protein LJ707_01200 [Mucilaginibacter sp. UR6-1]|uniref:hypothetical protein n=1 Tax=Mucilaginibacter sp. UR6-1 TaxID=1435643 RepID=UPI001E4105BA|nr:hypothetical protein [Mucilaginibacter sp. UR6-1]MCC8407527.1 hypothetical protein [Mucilaginibacter sp. UR6-1]